MSMCSDLWGRICIYGRICISVCVIRGSVCVHVYSLVHVNVYVYDHAFVYMCVYTFMFHRHVMAAAVFAKPSGCRVGPLHNELAAEASAGHQGQDYHSEPVSERATKESDLAGISGDTA